MIRRRMGAIGIPNTKTAALNLRGGGGGDHGPIVEEIRGLIRVYRDGRVERPPAVPEVPSNACALEPEVASRDVIISHSSGVWARFYVPKRHQQQGKLPLLVYFHGGGFCVGSAAWSCYHEFLARLATRAGCVVMSVNYRLAPEHRLPAAYEDGLAAVKWTRQQANSSDELRWLRASCNFNRVYLAGDSCGGNIAYNVAAQLGSSAAPYLKGLVLIQPFFGGETRTASERNLSQPPKSALTLATSDCYWRLALPFGADRDHPWSNPLGSRAPRRFEELRRLPPLLVCISEMDILKDRELAFCSVLKGAGVTVEQAVYAGVGHAFQVLHNWNSSQLRAQEMLADISAFLTNYT